MSGLFGTFNIAKRGMFVQQKSIDVTSHNIANANTEGYSRQRAKIETTRPAGMPSLTSVAEPGQLGTGSQISAIERIRDSFLDFQVRTETGTYGQYTSREQFLTEIESIFNEPSDTGISTLMGKFYDAWQQLSKQAQSSNARTVVAQQSSALADELNHAYKQLTKLKENAQSIIKNTAVDVNSMLDQIDELNQQIINVKVAGNMPNDLMDKRDLLLDQLSSKFNITIDKKNYEGYDIKASDEEGNVLVKAVLNSSVPVRRFSYVSSIEKVGDETYSVTYYKLGDMTSENNKQTITLTGVDEDAFRQLDQCRVLWADDSGNAIDAAGSPLAEGSSIDVSGLSLFQPSSGELKGYMSIQQDVDTYIDQLNSLAKALAFSVNAVHSGKAEGVDDKMPFFVNSEVAEYDSLNKNAMQNLEDILAAESEITAGNISVNKEILADVMKIKTRTNDDQYDTAAENIVDGESDGARALAIAQLRDTLLKIQDIDSNTTRSSLLGSKLMDKGLGIEGDVNGMKLDTYFKDTIDRLGIQSQEAQRIVKNQEALLSSFEESRASVSGVSLDEEMANLIQFQHAYQANAKMISTIDELLDVVVNGLKR